MSRFTLAGMTKEIRHLMKRNDAMGRSGISMALSFIQQNYGNDERNRVVRDLKLDVLFGFSREIKP